MFNELVCVGKHLNKEPINHINLNPSHSSYLLSEFKQDHKDKYAYVEGRGFVEGVEEAEGRRRRAVRR